MSPSSRSLRVLFQILMWCLPFVASLAQAQDYLEPEKAFLFSAKMVNANTVAVTYTIAEGYYMYKERFKFKAVNAKLGEAKIPPGKVKFDETFQKEVESYRKKVTIEIPVEATGEFTIISTGQGCADAGLCYPPLDSEAKLTVPKASPKAETKPDNKPLDTRSEIKPENKLDAILGRVGSNSAGAANVSSAANGVGSASAATSSAAAVAPTSGTATTYAVNSPPPLPTAAPLMSTPTATPATSPAPVVSAPPATDDAGRIASSFKSGKLIVILPVFFGFGLLLSLTPCVFPMVPILLSIIVGEGTSITRTRSMILSIAYVFGMTLVYTALGVAAGLVGEGLAASLQNPWVLGSVGVLMAVLSLSMFGFYQIQVPAALQSKLAATSEKGRGKLFGVFVMGAISALIVGPCVGPALVGALVFIGQTHDLVLGGSALFALGWGMGVPLLMIGSSAGFLLPRAGEWMESVTRFFGVVLLATALWLVGPVMPGAVTVLGWAILFLGYGAFLIWSKQGHWMSKGFGMVFSILGALQLVGAATGGRDPLEPLGHIRSEVAHHTQFQRVKSEAELDAVLAQTKGRPVMLDFYADWCVSCIEMEKLTFSDPTVKSRLDKMLLLQVDVTANSAEDKALLKRFQLFGPPGIIFFDKQGVEVPGRRVIGYQNSEKFLGSLAATQLLK